MQFHDVVSSKPFGCQLENCQVGSLEGASLQRIEEKQQKSKTFCGYKKFDRKFSRPKVNVPSSLLVCGQSFLVLQK